MQVAHRRHEADRALLATRRARAPRAARPWCGRPSCSRLACRARQRARRARRAPRRAAAARARSRASASRWRSTVASSPRAIGPVSASAPRSAQFAAVRRTSGASSSRASSIPIRVEQLGGRLLERDEEVGGDRGGGVVGGAPLLGHLEGAHPEALGELARRGGGPPALEPETAHGAPVRSAPPSGIVCSGWREKASAPRSRARRQGVERGGAADVADEAKRRHRGRDRRAGVGDRGVGNAQQRHLGPPAGFERLSRPASSAGTPASSAAAAIDRPARPAPTTASGGSQCAASGAAASGGLVPVLASEIPDGLSWSRW